MLFNINSKYIYYLLIIFLFKVNKMSDEEFDEKFLNIFSKEPKKLIEFIQTISSNIGEENFSKIIDKTIKNDNVIKKEKERQKLGELIKFPKINNDIEHFKLLNELIDEINKCYYYEIYTSLGLISRKAIIVVANAISKKDEISIIPFSRNNKMDINKKEKLNFNDYIQWLFDNNYLTKFNRDNLMNMKENSNFFHHSEFMINQEEGKKYFKIIKSLIESNFEVEDLSFNQMK